ncbi:MAG: fibronectin type III domain-containing protein [Nitrospirae bacterium]|nr:fibronectin type III domain-containing protein [Candidatus Manganitrophaceae bacterium]
MIKKMIPKNGFPSQYRDLFLRIFYFFISTFIFTLFTTSTGHADTLILHPSGKNANFAAVGSWTVVGGGFTYATVFDSNDSDTSYIQDSALNDKLYMDLDDTTLTGWTINDVQVFAVARVTGSSTNIQIGFRAGTTDTSDRLGSSRSVRSSSYSSYSGNLYTTNPRTSAPWTWTDINSLIPMVLHASNANALRITEVYVKVNYTKAISPSGRNALTSVWNGTGTISSSGTTVTGSGTSFNTKLLVGSIITAAGQTRTVTAIASATSLTVNSTFSPNLSAGTSWTYIGWAYSPAGSEATALDTNDGDTSYVQSITQDDSLYIDLDDFPNGTTAITGVRLNVVAKCITIPCNMEVGIRTNGTDYVTGFDEVQGSGTIYSTGTTSIHGNATNFTSQLAVGSQITAMGQTRTVSAVTDSNDLTVSSAFSPQLPTSRDSAVPFTFIGGTTSYQTFTSDFYTHNPATLAAWTWNDINSLIAVINHRTNANGIRVTQVYLSINYIDPVALSYTPDTGYGSTSGVYPDSGNASTSFKYKVVYTNLNNNPPSTIKVYIDGDGGHTMTRDANTEDPDFNDLDYTNGEQYVYTAASLSSGQHNYYFSASDGSDSAQKPSVGTLAAPGVAIAAGTDTILPSADNALTTGDWGFNGGDASSALDTADGNTTYADNAPSDNGETLYLDLDDSALTGSITAVQVSAVMCAPSSAASVRLGLQLNGTDYLSSAFSVAVSASCAAYTTYTPASALFKINPDTGKSFTWDDINQALGIVLNESTNAVRITQFKVLITHTPVILSFSDDPGYDSIDGVNPDSGNNTTSFTYKVIYSNANGTAPAAGYPKVHIDGNATGVAMTLDTNVSDPTLHDGNYIDGEQYTYTYSGGFPTGTTRSYYFDASDGTASVVSPVSGNYSGPAISLPAGSFILYPSDSVDGTSGFSFCNSGFRRSDCFDPTTALDTNDGDTTYARGRNTDDYLYMSLDDARSNGQFITSVQVSAIVRSESGTINFTLGLSTADNLIEGSVLSTSSTTYTTLSGTAYGFNPLTGAPWTWTDIQKLIAVVHHTNASKMRVTQLYVTVNYGPVQLQTSTESGYIADGVNPDLGNTSTQFKFKTVYYQINNVAPAANNPKVHIDGNATGVAMTLDSSAAATLHDGNYANGEQYVYTATLSQGSHTYYFDASDGTNTARSPAGTATYNGPYVSLTGASPNLAPSGLTSSGTAATTGWTFCNSTPTCSSSGTSTYANAVALDTNDGDTSFARSTVNGDRLYMEIDPPATLPDALSIISVQVSVVARDTSSSTTTGLDFGLRLGITDYLSGSTKTPADAYGTLSGTLYTTNPATGENWTWNDINGMGAVVVHQTNNNEVRVTQLYLTITYSPINLTFASDPRYFDDGVDPNGGTTGTSFSYRIVYTQAFGVAPAAGYPKVHIDGSAGGVAMTLDTQASAALHDGDYTNGEQYVYTTTGLAAQGAPHNYYFDVSDGTNTARTPLSGTLSGPVVSSSAPTLSFANQTGYTLRSTGTGTLSTSGTNTVTGTGTSFTTQLQVGTTITTASGQTRTVTAISSNTSLTVDTPFSPNLSGTTFSYAAWSGTGTLTTSGTTTVTGTGTSFQTQLQVGSTITAAGQTRTVMTIASNTSLTVDTAFSPNLSGAAFTSFFTDLPLRGVEPNTGTVSTPFIFKIVYTDADNNPPVTGYPRLLLDYNTTVYAMNPDTGATVTGAGTISSSSTTVTGSGTNFLAELVVGDTITASAQTKTVTAIASATSLTVNSAFSSNLSSGTSYTHNGISDGNYTNGEQYTVTVYMADPGTHAYSFDATDGVTPVVWPLNGDGFLAPSVTDSVSSGVIVYPASRNSQTSGFTFLGNDQDPSTALDAGYPGNGTISNASGSTTVTGVGSNFTTMSVGSIVTAGSPQQKRRVTAIANDTSFTSATAFSPNLSSVPWLFDGDISYARATRTNNKLYMNMDDTVRSTAVITSVQSFAIIRDAGSNNINFSVGLQVGGTDYTSAYTTPGNSTYTTYASTLYNNNPKTGAAWTWNDVASLLGVVKLTKQDCFRSGGCNEVRVTQIYVQVNYNSLPTLSYSPEGGYYGTDGVDPDGWNPAHIYTYKVVYASGSNFAPTSIKVYIDGVGFNMSHDGSFITNDPLRNGDYTDGEQFYYSTTANQLAVGSHTYYFVASDGSNTYTLPTSAPSVPLPGPNVSVNEPFLQFSSATGYGTDGVNPDNGESGSTQFTYKVVYTHPDNNRPLYVKVHIDGDSGRLMSLDSSASAALKDGNYVNGEQYTYSTNLGIGSHTYLFEASDGGKQVFLPLVPSLGIFSGPTVTDSVAPNAVTNLAISARTPNSTTLTWTAPGDAGTGSGCPCGTVTSYNIRYSTLKIVDDAATPAVGEVRFSNATAATTAPTPQSAGSTETFTIQGLNPNTPYYFALKSSDAKPWTSPLSNVVNAASSPPIPATNLLSGWNMVSVPMTPSPADVATVFGSSVGVPVNVKKWVSTGTTNQTGSFDLLSATDTVLPGVGYFLESPDDTRFLNPAGSANSAATFTIPLSQGYNIIGNPYTKDVSLDTTCVGQNGGTGTCTSSANAANFKSYANAVAAGWVGNALYRWDGAAYTFKTYNDPDPAQKATLQLWQGYWLQVTDANAANTYNLIVVKP